MLEYKKLGFKNKDITQKGENIGALFEQQQQERIYPSERYYGGYSSTYTRLRRTGFICSFFFFFLISNGRLSQLMGIRRRFFCSFFSALLSKVVLQT